MTTLSNGPNRQNKPGLTHYRSRLIARAKTLVEDEEFREAIRQFRVEWNTKFYRFPIRPVETSGELQSQLVSGKVEFCTFPQGLTPRQLGSSEEHEALKEWENQITGMCTRFWPDKIHGVDGRPASTLRHPHPAFLFVTACVFCYPLGVQKHADWFFANFASTVQILPYQPMLMDRYDKLALHGEMFFWKSIARGFEG